MEVKTVITFVCNNVAKCIHLVYPVPRQPPSPLERGAALAAGYERRER